MKNCFNEMIHFRCRMDRQRVLCVACSWRNIGCHFANKVELPIGRCCEQRMTFARRWAR